MYGGSPNPAEERRQPMGKYIPDLVIKEQPMDPIQEYLTEDPIKADWAEHRARAYEREQVEAWAKKVRKVMGWS